jgi:hypothetical protein
MTNGDNLLRGRDIFRLVEDYIGVTGGYLGDFSYRSHEEFYRQFCDLDMNPSGLPGTTRQRFIQILSHAPPAYQARIIRGILEKYPVESAPGRTKERYDYFSSLAQRVEGNIVAAPEPRATRDVVLEALRDAEILIRDGRPTSAVDRVHTALHGHLHALCEARHLATPNQATLNQLFNALRQTGPELQPTGARADDINRVIRSTAAILDALNPVRNQATLAHPNAELLEDAEAMLVVNVTRSLLAYIDAKLGT